MTDPALAPDKRPPRTWRRWLRFSLRGAFVVLTGTSLALGGYVNRCEQQRHAVAAIEAAGGTVSHECVGEHSFSCGFSIIVHGTYWQRQMQTIGLPVDYYAAVVGVNLCMDEVTSQTLSQLHHFPNLVELDLSHATLDDADLVSLGHIQSLQTLNLRASNITDDDLQCLVKLPALRHLYLEETQITDQGLRSLSSCKNLEHLGLSSTAISDAGLVHLTHLPELWSLDLDHTQVADAGLVNLAQLSRLRYLMLDGNKIQGAGIQNLPRQLETLTIGSNTLEASEAIHFLELKSLEFLYVVVSPPLDAETQTYMQALLPQTSIVFENSDTESN